MSVPVPNDKKEAVCLHAEVSALMQKVNKHITLLDPKNVADRLKAVANSIEAKNTVAAQKQELADKADKTANAAGAPIGSPLRNAANTAQAEALKATDEANKEQAENTVSSLAAEASDFSDLQCLPDVQACGNPPDCQLPTRVCQ